VVLAESAPPLETSCGCWEVVPYVPPWFCAGQAKVDCTPPRRAPFVLYQAVAPQVAAQAAGQAALKADVAAKAETAAAAAAAAAAAVAGAASAVEDAAHELNHQSPWIEVRGDKRRPPYYINTETEAVQVIYMLIHAQSSSSSHRAAVHWHLCLG
jgi:hypothetical protein